VNLRQGYDLEDLLLIPKLSSVTSRDEVELSRHINELRLKIPIIASPMSGIVGVELIKGLGKLGGIGILHRFYNDITERIIDLETLAESAINFGVAVGLNDKFYKAALDLGASIICIDVANGYLASVMNFTSIIADYIVNNGYTCLVMAGNVATYEGARCLFNAGAILIRTGIGSGQLCTTRNEAGVGIPQATAIIDCSHKMVNVHLHDEYKIQTNDFNPWYTVADGGIKNSGDGIKALACGADLLMIGSLFASCFESDNNGEILGMASKEFQEQFYGEVKKSVEGTKKKVEKTISLDKFIDKFMWNMKSGFTYCNARNIAELHKNAEFIITGSESIVQK
jgi:IMP dehydrogenase